MVLEIGTMDAEKWAAVKAEIAKSDLQNDGFIPQDVLKAVFRNLGDWSDGEFEVLFAKVAQKDGKVKYEELLKLLEDGKKPPQMNSVTVDLLCMEEQRRRLQNPTSGSDFKSYQIFDFAISQDLISTTTAKPLILWCDERLSSYMPNQENRYAELVCPQFRIVLVWHVEPLLTPAFLGTLQGHPAVWLVSSYRMLGAGLRLVSTYKNRGTENISVIVFGPKRRTQAISRCLSMMEFGSKPRGHGKRSQIVSLPIPSYCPMMPLEILQDLFEPQGLTEFFEMRDEIQLGKATKVLKAALGLRSFEDPQAPLRPLRPVVVQPRTLVGHPNPAPSPSGDIASDTIVDVHTALSLASTKLGDCMSESDFILSLASTKLGECMSESESVDMSFHRRALQTRNEEICQRNQAPRENAKRSEMERRGIGAPSLSQESVSESSTKARLLLRL